TGLGLLGWLPWSMPGLIARTRKSAGQVSRVRSVFVEMELDHDSGAMRGRILAGRHEGAILDALDIATLTGFLSDIDEESRALLMAYLDRREPRWREHAQADATAGADRRTWRGGKMTEEEAYQILASGFRLVLVEAGKAGAIVGGAPLVDRFGEGFRAREHFGRLPLHRGEALFGGLLARVRADLNDPAWAVLCRLNGGLCCRRR